ncbi:hypothetical protein B4U79_17980 [Dinothrombium tinctorium]|uniref:Uncharacterized protein n=1 Tax=Dinothrombium tinctorium TaxID=1965070 RepID=A0A3S3QRP3_9ACAR|nr:hypothetical protein B4U79_17983 [Dinothrombium tinctorium]RWS12970.1 hypothetical protein B4U79_17980 [Dinothrombium tinctorium]
MLESCDYFSRFINVKTLVWRKTTFVKKISLTLFGGKVFQNLHTLDLSENEIEELDEEIFRYFPRLTHLKLNNNRIIMISWSTLAPIWFNLSEFQLNGNPLDCHDYCWIYDEDKYPHPQFFDSTSCQYHKRGQVRLTFFHKLVEMINECPAR